MKLKLLTIALLLACLPFLAEADKGGKGKGKGNSNSNGNKNGHYKANSSKKVVKAKPMPPGWAKKHGYANNRHVYFPDYYTFYDPNRGYVYWNKAGYWVTSTSKPYFLNKVDLGVARIQILNSEALTAQPELRYTTFVNQYPGKIVGVAVPIPPR
jgi:hypothetical protein